MIPSHRSQYPGSVVPLAMFNLQLHKDDGGGGDKNSDSDDDELSFANVCGDVLTSANC